MTEKLFLEKKKVNHTAIFLKQKNGMSAKLFFKKHDAFFNKTRQITAKLFQKEKKTKGCKAFSTK